MLREGSNLTLAKSFSLAGVTRSNAEAYNTDRNETKKLEKDKSVPSNTLKKKKRVDMNIIKNKEAGIDKTERARRCGKDKTRE